MSSDVTIAVVGAGAIGTSIGLALMRLEDRPRLLVHDKVHGTAREAANKMKAFDKADWNLINTCDEADAIILALPTNQIRETLEALAPHLKENAVVSDTSPTKRSVVKMAEEILPETVHFVGGHPIVSTVGNGPKNASAELFEEALYCFTPANKAHPDAVKFMQDLASLMGATPFFLDAEEHDGLLSGVNHMPLLLSVALINGVSEPASWVEMRRMAGQLFAHLTMGATGDPDSIASDLIGNRDNVLRWLNYVISALEQHRELLQAGDQEALAQLVDQAVVARRQWQEDFSHNRLDRLTREKPLAVEQASLMERLFGRMATPRNRSE